MNIKSIWLYTALAACLGSGYGLRAVTSPSVADMERAVMEARSNCETTPAERQWKQGKFREHGTKGF